LCVLLTKLRENCYSFLHKTISEQTGGEHGSGTMTFAPDGSTLQLGVRQDLLHLRPDISKKILPCVLTVLAGDGCCLSVCLPCSLCHHVYYYYYYYYFFFLIIIIIIIKERFNVAFSK